MIKNLLYQLRNIVYHQALESIKKYSKGNVLDVGGGEFYKSFLRFCCDYDSYTIADKRRIILPQNFGDKIRYRYSDAEKMVFADESFNTVLCIHMLEHTMEPLRVISEVKRVLKKDGIAIFLLPQTSIPHDIPDHYYNFTRYFIERALAENGLKIVEEKMLGGAFQTIASHLFHLPLFLFGHPNYRETKIKRSYIFYITMPLKILFLPLLFIISVVLSAGDIKEVANNILVVAKKI